MDFEFDDEQLAFRTAARSLLQARCPPAETRRLETDARGYDPALWAEMARLGWLGLALPGGGGTILDLAIVFEELGRAVCPTPLFSTVAVGGLTLADAGRLPDGVATGEVLIGSALVDADPAWLHLDGDSARPTVSGRVTFACDLHAADLVLVCAGPSLVLLDARHPGIEAVPLTGMSHDRLFEARLDKVPGTAVGNADTLLPRALARASVLRCAELTGVMGRALEMACDYARARVQFGRPIGTFQAIQHRLADMLLDVEGARWTTYRAAWRIARGDPAERDVAVAKAWTADASQRVAFGAQQVHGGIGVDLAYDLQLYFRRAKALELEFGAAPATRAALAGMIGLASSAGPGRGTEHGLGPQGS